MTYMWPLVNQFRNRSAELEQLERWWNDSASLPLAVYGRRRVGKSWLLRRFAHGKPATVLVASQIRPGAQYGRFAQALTPLLGLTPAITDLASLIEVLHKLGANEKYLVVLDEFPWLLPTTERERIRELSAVQAILEDVREASQLKLIVCGSLIGQMEGLMSERAPLRGRLAGLSVPPLQFRHAREYFPKATGIDAFQRYAISGGMPYYLNRLADQNLAHAIQQELLTPTGPLFDEPRVVLDEELREAKTYFTVLAALSGGDKELGELANSTGISSGPLSKYMGTLDRMHLITRKLPIEAARDSRKGHWHLDDDLFRFWFRFVFPFQEELSTGLSAADLYNTEIAPALADHTASAFESWCRSWVRQNQGSQATRVGSWWGRALDSHRRTKERETEEIDIVGTSRKVVTIAGEAKWTNKTMPLKVLQDLENYKLPALRQAGLKVSPNVHIFLFSRSGYAAELSREAQSRRDITLVNVAAELDQ